MDKSRLKETTFNNSSRTPLWVDVEVERNKTKRNREKRNKINFLKKRNEPESCDLKRNGTKRNTRALEHNTKRNETERYEIERNATEHSYDYAEKEWNGKERFKTEQNETDHRRAQRKTERTGMNRK